MPNIGLLPVKRLIKSFDRISPPSNIRVFLNRAKNPLQKAFTFDKHDATLRGRQDAVLASGEASLEQRCEIHKVARPGMHPTIVLGGFVPDSCESVFLLKDLFLKQGSIYCLSYPVSGFSLELLFAQLEDLVDEVTMRHGNAPVIFSVSFGSGVVLEWLRRRKQAGLTQSLGGLIMVSPVTCVDDLIDRGAQKPSTLLGRAIKPYLDPEGKVEQATVERSRTIFSKMFESGAQNREAVGSVMSGSEARWLRDRVMRTIQSIDFSGACERVRALKQMIAPDRYFDRSMLPLCEAPTLLLYAEKEDSVVTERSPARFVFETAHKAYFPRSRCLLVSNPGGTPVQHASLIFHHQNFRPALSAFYRSLRKRWIPEAA